MLVQLLRQRIGRIPRFLMHPTLVKSPFVANLMRKFGGILACKENADHTLAGGQILGVFPEGVTGAFKLYKEAHEIGGFGRPDYISMAHPHRAPIVPFVIVGSSEIYPILGRIRWRWFRHKMEWPFLPVVPSPVPLPTKWHIKFLPPIELPDAAVPGEALGSATVCEIHAAIAGRIQCVLDEMRGKRRSIFRGSIFAEDSPPKATDDPK